MGNMTKKDYELIANTLAGERNYANDDHTRVVIDSIAIRLAEEFQDENPQFDRNKFLSTCCTPIEKYFI